MAEVKRKKNETFDALFRRFQRRIQSSGRVMQVKKGRFLKKAENPNKRRESALRREEMRSKYDYELKTGKLKIEPKKKSH